MNRKETKTTVINQIIKSDIGKYSVSAKKFSINGEVKTTPIIVNKREEKTVTVVKLLRNGKILLVDKWNPSIEAWHSALPSSEDIEKSIESFDSVLIKHILCEDNNAELKGIDTFVLSTKLDGKFYSSINDIVILSGVVDFDEEKEDGLYLGDFVYACLEGDVTDPATVVAGLKLYSLLCNLPKQTLNRMNGAFAEGVLSPSFENPYPKNYTDQHNDWLKGKDFVLKYQAGVSALLETLGS